MSIPEAVVKYEANFLLLGVTRQASVTRLPQGLAGVRRRHGRRWNSGMRNRPLSGVTLIMDRIA